MDTLAQVAARKMKAHYNGDASRWTQGCGARDAEGKRVDVDSPRAVCWCWVAVIGMKLTPVEAPAFETTWSRLTGKLRIMQVEWNDAPDRRFADIEKMLDRIIAGE